VIFLSDSFKLSDIRIIPEKIIHITVVFISCTSHKPIFESAMQITDVKIISEKYNPTNLGWLAVLMTLYARDLLYFEEKTNIIPTVIQVA